MRAMDVDGYEQRFDEERGRWVPLIARDSEGNNHLFKPESNTWEQQKTGDEQLSTLQKLATSIPWPSDSNQGNNDGSIEPGRGNTPAKIPELAGADNGAGVVRNEISATSGNYGSDYGKDVNFEGLKEPLPDAEGNFKSQDFPSIQKKIANQSAGDNVILGAFKKASKDVMFGYDESASTFYNTAANISMLLDKASDYMSEATGMDKGGAFNTVENYLRGISKQAAPDPSQAPQDTIGKIYSGFGAAPVAIGEYIPAIRALGPILGFAAVDALSAADQGPEATLEAGVKGAAMGGVLKTVEPLTRPGKMAALAVVGGTAAAAEGGDASDITAGAVVLGGLGAMAPGNVRVRDIPRNVAEAYPRDPIKKHAKNIKRSKFTANPDEVVRRSLDPEQAQFVEKSESKNSTSTERDISIIRDKAAKAKRGEPLTPADKWMYVDSTNRMTPEQVIDSLHPLKPLEIKADDIKTVTETVRALNADERLTKAQEKAYQDAISRMDTDQVRAIIYPETQKLPVSEQKPATEQPKEVEAAQAKVKPEKTAPVEYQKRVKSEREKDQVRDTESERVRDTSARRTGSEVPGKPVEKALVVTDPVEVQKIRNSIAEGEGILKSGRDSIGQKMSEGKLEGVRRSVESSKAKIGEPASSEKEPWQMTRGEWAKESAKKPSEKNKDVSELTREKVFSNSGFHKRHVEKALSDGKSVPEEVLKDYPELTLKVKKEPAKADIPADVTGKADKKTASEPEKTKAKARRRPANADFAQEKSQAEPQKKKSTRGDPESAVPERHISPDGLKMHELIELAEILTGRTPKVKHNWPSDLRGKMSHKGDDARVFINGMLSKDPGQALKTLAHEIGHVVDWVDPKTLKLGNILGHVAGVKKHLKKFLSESPDAKEGPLTPADIRRLKSEARKMAKLEYEKKIDKAIVEDYQVTPKDILDIWNAVEKSKIPGLDEYMARASTAEKKSIVKEAMKGLVPESVQAVARAAKAIKEGKKPDGSDMNEKAIFEMMFKDEVQRRRLFSRDILMTELKEVSMEWRPFKRGDAKYDKYRDSPAELYADAVSMFFNHPEMLRSMAPEFFRGFNSWAKNRPIAMRAIGGLLKARGGSLARLDERISKAFDRAELKRASEYERDVKTQSGSWMGAKSALYDKYAPILDLVEKVDLKPGENPRFAIEALTHVNTRNEGYLADFSESFIKLGGSEKLVNVAGKYMLYERIIGEHKAGNDRFAIGGITHVEAIKLKDAIDKEYGSKIGDFTKRFREIRKDWIMDVMAESGLYSEAMKKAFIREDGHYATFKNVAFIDAMDQLYTGGTGFATIKQRLGSFSDIENPVMATLAQDITMLAAAERNHVVRKTTNMLSEHFKGDIRPAEKAWDGKALSFVDLHPKADEGLVIFMDDGQKKGFYISRSIADALKDPKRTNEVEYFVNFSLSQPGRAIKTLFTEANPGFWVTNVMRDYARGATGTPGANAITFLPSYLRAIPESIKSGFGKDSPRIKEMLKNYELISVADYRSLNQQDGQLYRLLARFHVSPSDLKQPKTLSGKVGKAIKKGWFYYSGVARGLERIPKVAAIRYLEKHKPGISKEERRHMILGQIGSPDFLRAGSEMKVYNNILLFGNAIKEGIRSDIEVIKDRPADYFFNAFTITYLPRILMLLTAAGYMDSDTDKKAAIINKQTDYRKHNSTLIPLGFTEKGESVAFSIALDPFQKFQVNLLEAGIKGAYSGDLRKMLKDLSHTMRGELPGITPIIDLYKDINAFADETQILTYRGHPVFSRKALAQAPIDPSLLRNDFYSYLWNNYGGSMLYRIPGGDIEKTKSDLVKALDLPIAGNILRRLISVSDYGEVQKIKEATAKIDANRSLAKQRIREAIINIANKDASDEDRAIYMNSIKAVPKQVARIVKSIQKAKQPALVRELWKIRKDPEKLKAATEALK